VREKRTTNIGRKNVAKMSDSRITLTQPTLRDMLLGTWRGQRLWLAKSVYVSAFAVFAALAVLAHTYAYFSWDLAAARALQGLPVPGLVAFMRDVSFFGEEGVCSVMIAATVIVFLLLRWHIEVAALLLSVEGSRFIDCMLKLLVARPRPTPDHISVFVHVGGESFPSKHVMLYVCYFGFLFFISYVRLPRGSVVRRIAQLTTALLVILIGPSRVVLGAHWPSDTIGAYLAGGLWLALSLNVYRWCNSSQRDEATETDARLTASSCRDSPPP
jgi:membrane-associated phospholipid phosphatase